MKKVKASLEDLLPTIEAGFNNYQIVEIKVSGNSMYPFLKHQQTTIGLKKFVGKLKRYHIYFFQYEEKYILHRYIKAKDNKLFFKGDRLHKYEYPSKEQILAEVEYIITNNHQKNPYTLISILQMRINTFWNNIRNILILVFRRKK